MGLLAVVIGIPGVGKTTVLDNFMQICREKRNKATVLNIGTLMLDEAVSRGLARERDGLRGLTLTQQWDLREASVHRILSAKKEFDVVLLDTHFMVRSRGGYLVALPRKFLEGISPDFFAVIEASVDEIVHRRRKDTTRSRDAIDPSEVRLEQDLTRQAIFVLASVCNANVIRVVNKRNQAAQAARKLYEFFLEGA